MKPDWSYAPEWAQFLAQDLDGVWYWYEDEPIIAYPGDAGWSYGGRSRKAGLSSSGWDQSLERRP